MQFYDELSDYYHLLFEDWNASIERQTAVLDAIIGGAPKRIDDQFFQPLIVATAAPPARSA